MNANSLFSIMLVLSFVPSVIKAEETEKLAAKFPLLARLRPPQGELPIGCPVKEVPSNIPALKGFENQSITVNPKLFLLTDPRLSKVIDVKSIQAAYIGMYGDTEECGVVGLALANSEFAQKAHDAVAAQYAGQDRVRLWKKGNSVVWLWRDRSKTNACYEYLEKYVNSQMQVGDNE